MSSTNSTPERSWSAAAALAQRSVRDRMSISRISDLDLDSGILESRISDGSHRPELVATTLQRMLANVARVIPEESPAVGKRLEDHFRCDTILSLFECISMYLTRTRDSEFWERSQEEQRVEDDAFLILNRFWEEHYDAERGLLFSIGSLDAVVPLPESIDSISSHPRCASCYINLYAYQTLKQISKQFPPERASLWSSRIKQLGERSFEQFWDPESSTLRHSIFTESHSPAANSSWEGLKPHTLARFIASGLLGKPKVDALAILLERHFRSPESGSLGMASTPPAPQELLSAFSYQGVTHIAGSNHTQLCLSSARALHVAGYPALARMILTRVAERAQQDGGFFPWYTSDDCPQGQPDSNTARAFLNAWVEIRPQQQNGSSTLPSPSSASNGAWQKNKFLPKRHLQRKKQRYQEKRAALRIPLEIQAHVRKSSILPGHALSGAIRFPSATGMALQSSAFFPEGTVLQIQVDTRSNGGSGIVKLKGKVVWTQHKAYNLLHQCGVHLAPNSGDIAEWHEFMDHKIQERRNGPIEKLEHSD